MEKRIEDYKIIKIGDKEYPNRLSKIKNAPETLYVKGDYSLLNKLSIAIVGSRKCDEYGKIQAKRFASYLSQKNICIISGLATGIDTMAHLYSMENEGKTIAVIASGFEHIYPTENKILFEKILENGGAIVSEYEQSTEIDMRKFPIRNRIISGLSAGVLVVEARIKSGSMITGRLAIKQNKELFCIPRRSNKYSLRRNKWINIRRSDVCNFA